MFVRAGILQGGYLLPIGQRVNSNMTFTAQYDEVVSETPAIPPISPEPSIPLDSPTEEPTTEPEDVFYNCRFEAGEHGSIEAFVFI